MARQASPWFWEERNGWSVTKAGQRHFLGDHPDGAPTPRKVKGAWNVPDKIRLKFHQLMTEESAPIPSHFTPTKPAGLSVASLFEKYLEWCSKHRSPRRYEGYVW